MAETLLKPAEVAERLGISRSKTYQLMSEGRLPVLRVGASVRVPEASLDRWIAERTIKPRDGA